MGQGARFMLAGIVIVALAVAAWFSLETDDGDRVAFGDGDGSDAFVAEDELSAEGEAERAPALEGRKAAPKKKGPTRYGPVDVIVVGPMGIPLPFVQIEALPPTPKEGEAETNPLRAETDDAGKALFANLPWDGTWTVRPFQANRPGRENIWVISMGDSQSGGSVRIGDSASAQVSGPRVRLELRSGLPMSIRVVSASGGHVFETGAWGVKPNMENSSGTIELTDEPVKAVALTPATDGSVEPYLAEIPGHVRKRGLQFNAWISPRARSLTATVPVHSEAELFITLPDDVTLTSDTDWSVTYAVGGGFKGKARAVADSYDRVRLLGVPFVPGEPVHLRGQLRKDGHLWASGRFPYDEREGAFLEAQFKPFGKKYMKRVKKTEVVRAKLDALKVEQVRLAVVLEDRVQALGKYEIRLADLAKQKAADDALRATNAEALQTQDVRGALKVVIRTNKGKPAVGAQVWLGNAGQTAGGDGSVLFEKLDPGEHPLKIAGAGTTFLATGIVEAKAKNTLELTAPEGGTIDVEAVDEEGRPLPFAKVQLSQPSGLHYCNVQDGVQRIDRYVDSRGRRSFRGVETGEVKVVVTFGSRYGTGKATVTDGGVVHARVVLAAPKPTAAMEASKESLQRLQEALDSESKASAKANALMEQNDALKKAYEALKRARKPDGGKR